MKAPASILALALGTIAITALAQDSGTAEQLADQQVTTVNDPEESFVEVEATDNSQSDKLSDTDVSALPLLQTNLTEDAPDSFWHPEPKLTIRDILPFLGYLAGAIIGFGGIVFSVGRIHKLARQREEELNRNDTKALAAALASEVFMLTSLCRGWNNFITALPQAESFGTVGAWVDYLRTPRPLLFEKNAGKIGHLNRVTKGTVTEVVKFYSKIYTLDKYIDAAQSLFDDADKSTFDPSFVSELLGVAGRCRNLTAYGIEAFAYLKLVETGIAEPNRGQLDQAALECINELDEDKGSILEVAEKFGVQSSPTVIWKEGQGVIEERKNQKTKEH